MTVFRKLPAAVIGRLGETLAHRLLRQIGAGVIATLKFSGENDNEAPALEFHDKRIVTADFDVSMRGQRFWLELKTYKEPKWNYTHRCLVHGVPLRLFDEYVAGEKETGTPLFLGVLEVDSGILLVSELPLSQMQPRYACLCGCDSAPARCEYRAQWGSGYPQWYFRRDGFREWSRLVGDDLKKLQAEHARLSPSLRKPTPHHRASKDGVFVDINPPWTWACLACNATGLGDASKHRCDPRAPFSAQAEYWRGRVGRACHDLSEERVAAIVSRPIDRADIARWFGALWSPSGDVA